MYPRTRDLYAILKTSHSSFFPPKAQQHVSIYAPYMHIVLSKSTPSQETATWV